MKPRKILFWVVRWQPWSSESLGRRLRVWARFLHTGEAGGLAGQTAAAIASAGACILVFTGLSLSLRRVNAWMRPLNRPTLLPISEAISGQSQVARGDEPTSQLEVRDSA